MTPGLTQSLSHASRASLAVTTASRAVKQPAVFGSSSTPHSSRTSVSEPRACGSIRRSAIVTSSARVARIASASVSRRLKPPVPRMRRERSVRPPTCSGVSVTGICSVLTGRSASLHGGQRLDARPLDDAALGPLGARNDLAVDRDRDAAGALLDAEVDEQLGDGGAGALARLAVDEDHAATPAKRTGENAGSGSPPPHSTSETSPAVTGVSSAPLR